MVKKATMESKTRATMWKSIKTVPETGVKSDLAFCLGSLNEKTNSARQWGYIDWQRQIFFSRNRKCKKKLSLCSYLEYASSTFQHLPPTLPCHVHLRHLRNEFLHECQAQRNPRLGLQLRDFRTIHDITIPGKKFFNRITLRTRRTLCAYL